LSEDVVITALGELIARLACLHRVNILSVTFSGTMKHPTISLYFSDYVTDFRHALPLSLNAHAISV
jgi:hypothetical protein